jgi:hypothetical protein
VPLRPSPGAFFILAGAAQEKFGAAMSRVPEFYWMFDALTSVKGTKLPC